jgi:hypothetical protein
LAASPPSNPATLNQKFHGFHVALHSLVKGPKVEVSKKDSQFLPLDIHTWVELL